MVMVPGMHLTAIGQGCVLLEPTDGFDPGDPEAYLVPLAGSLQRLRARRLLYDLKTVPVVDGLYFAWLSALAAMCRISGIGMVVVSMRPATAYALALTMKGPPPFECALDVNRARSLAQPSAAIQVDNRERAQPAMRRVACLPRTSDAAGARAESLPRKRPCGSAPPLAEAKGSG